MEVSSCLGHQLLADALGGAVRPAARPEIGLYEVGLNQAGRTHPLFAGLPATERYLQWHVAEVVQPPPGAAVLAHSKDCAIQALAVGERAFGLQFHAEVDVPTLDDWFADPSTHEAMIERRGPEGPERYLADARAHMAALNAAARQLFLNFRALI